MPRKSVLKIGFFSKIPKMAVFGQFLAILGNQMYVALVCPHFKLCSSVGLTINRKENEASPGKSREMYIFMAKIGKLGGFSSVVKAKIT